MAKALTPVKLDGTLYNEGDDLPELSEETLAQLVEAGAVEDPDAEDVDEDVEDEDEDEE